MSLRSKATKGSLFLSIGEGVGYGASFIRNMILARLLAKADFGIASTFAMVVGLFEFSAKMGMARFLVRDPEGERPQFVAAAHLVQFWVAVSSAVVICAAAFPVANLFGIAPHAWALMLLAVIPLLRAIQNLDVARRERELLFGRSMIVEAVPQIIITIAAWPVAQWFGDFRAILVLLLGKAFCSCIASHLLAEHPYRWCLHREYVLRMLRFGWPLVVNGLLMFGVMQGDQFLVGTFYNMTVLGPYAAAVALAFAPSYLFGRVCSPVILPLLARTQKDIVAFRRRYNQTVAAISCFAAAATVGLVFGAEAIMRIAYGPKYAGSGILLACLAAVSGLRMVRLATSVAALAKGDSQNEMWANGSRVMSLLLALPLAIYQQPVWTIASAGLLGEALASSVAVVRLRRRDGIPLAATFVPMGWVGFAVTVSALTSIWWGVDRWPATETLLVASLMAIGTGALLVWRLPQARAEALALVDVLRSNGWRLPFSRKNLAPEAGKIQPPP